MIVVETWAICGNRQCQRRQLADDHPVKWPRITDGDRTDYYCSWECLRASVTGDRENPYGLTHTDLDIVRRVADGRANGEIAHSIGLAESTVKNRLSVVFRKLNVEDRTQLALRAYALGLVTMPMAAAA